MRGFVFMVVRLVRVSWVFYRSARTIRSVIFIGQQPGASLSSGYWWMFGLSIEIPGNGFFESFGQRCAGFKLKELFGEGHVQATTRLTIGLGWIELDLSLKPRFFGNQLDEC